MPHAEPRVPKPLGVGAALIVLQPVAVHITEAEDRERRARENEAALQAELAKIPLPPRPVRPAEPDLPEFDINIGVNIAFWSVPFSLAAALVSQQLIIFPLVFQGRGIAVLSLLPLAMGVLCWTLPIPVAFRRLPLSLSVVGLVIALVDSGFLWIGVIAVSLALSLALGALCGSVPFFRARPARKRHHEALAHYEQALGDFDRREKERAKIRASHG